MKRFNIIASLAALCALFTACEKTNIGGDLQNLQISKSYIAFAETGGSETVKVVAVEDWNIDAATVPSWLTIAPTSGGAGETEVVFTTAANPGLYNSVQLKVVSGAETQMLVVQQGEPVVKEMTVAEILNGVNGATYRVTGKVKSIDDAKRLYGNWYLYDDTGELQIYGTKYDGQTQQYALDKYGIEIGDQVTVEGPYDSGYKELKDVTVIKVVKSLLQLAGESSLKAGKDGGIVDVNLLVKGDNLDVKPACEWIRIASITTKPKQKKDLCDTTVVSLFVDANVDKGRTGSVVFESSSKGQSSAATVTVEQETGLSAQPLPYSWAFETSLGDFTVNDVDVSKTKSGSVWSFASGYGAKATAGQACVSESWLVSPNLDIPAGTSATLSFDHVRRYANNVYEELTLWASTNDGESWEQILIPNYSTGSDWNFVTTSVSLNKFAGNHVRVGFCYKSNDNSYATWEMKNFIVKAEALAPSCIAQLQGLAINTATTSDFEVNLTNAVVTYVNGSNAFIEDATGGVLYYKSSHGLNVGDRFDGKVSGKITIYGGFPEVTEFNTTAATVTPGTSVTPTVITVDKLLKSFNRYVSCQVKLEDVKLDVALGSNRNANVLQETPEASIPAYAKVKNTVTIDANVLGSLICYPCYNNSFDKKQVGIWEAGHFTPAN